MRNPAHEILHMFMRKFNTSATQGKIDLFRKVEFKVESSQRLRQFNSMSYVELDHIVELSQRRTFADLILL